MKKLIIFIGFFMTSICSQSASKNITFQSILDDNTSSITIPQRSLKKNALQVSTIQEKSFLNLNDDEHISHFSLLTRIVSVWEKNKIADQYLVYAKQEKNGANFNWQIIPYNKTNNIISRIFQQFVVLFRITFGGFLLSDNQKEKLTEEYQRYFRSAKANDVFSEKKGSDSFCKDEVIERQSVLKGKYINVLYNYAPIGFGGEKLHFLITPIRHKSKFNELSKEEYLEAEKLTQRLIDHFYKTRDINAVYFFHKTGFDAGQSVNHFHQHVVLTTNKTQDMLGKLTVLKNMLFGSKAMSDEDLYKKVSSLREELR
jgi:diadenosine tetraphosphate (Ap4A) HIT family hydrolase